MNDRNAQPSTDSMTSQTKCFYSGCTASPKWGISSSVKHKNPDGSPLTLYACDGHEGTLTAQMRDAGTKYTLFPVGGPHMVPPRDCVAQTPEELFEQSMRELHPVFRHVINGVCLVVGLVIGPFLLAYYGGKWLLGWRPKG